MSTLLTPKMCSLNCDLIKTLFSECQGYFMEDCVCARGDLLSCHDVCLERIKLQHNCQIIPLSDHTNSHYDCICV